MDAATYIKLSGAVTKGMHLTLLVPAIPGEELAAINSAGKQSNKLTCQDAASWADELSPASHAIWIFMLGCGR